MNRRKLDEIEKADAELSPSVNSEESANRDRSSTLKISIADSPKGAISEGNPALKHIEEGAINSLPDRLDELVKIIDARSNVSNRIKDAKDWAKNNQVKTVKNLDTKLDFNVSRTSIDKMLEGRKQAVSAGENRNSLFIG